MINPDQAFTAKSVFESREAGMAPEILRQRGWSFRQGAKMTEKWCFRALFC